MSIRAIGSTIIVKEITESSTRDGLYVPDSISSNKHKKAEIISVGEGLILSSGSVFPPRVKVGEKICFNVARAVQVDKELYAITENDILFVED